MEELEMLLVAYTSHVSMFGELRAVSLACLIGSLENRLVPHVFMCLYSHASFVNHLIPSEAKLDLLCLKNENLHDDSFREPKVVESLLACAIFDVLHARMEGKLIEDNDYIEEENKGKVALFEKMIQDLDWNLVERQEEDPRG
ncbi:hypothetical protein M9H77_31197 [Catharanthus roseus]|uniref:Uncharacterized protein n=1 Tax=Catharanthus roseus TaxID=4058 RepID=A0ACB9ZZC6_CATRO|nr:hypothetical protein M9H77_31197 [Catharanthus roseus]